MTPEGKVQAAIRKIAKELGWWVLKFQVVQMVGFPDLMLLRSGKVIFIEVKRPGKKPTTIQEKRMQQIRRCGIPAVWFDNAEDAEVFLNGIK